MLLKNVASSQHLSTPNFLIILSSLTSLISYLRSLWPACMQFLQSTRFNLVFVVVVDIVDGFFRHLFDIVQIKLGVLGRQWRLQVYNKLLADANYLSSHWQTTLNVGFLCATPPPTDTTPHSVAVTMLSPTWIFPRRWTLVISVVFMIYIVVKWWLHRTDYWTTINCKRKENLEEFLNSLTVGKYPQPWRARPRNIIRLM